MHRSLGLAVLLLVFCANTVSSTAEEKARPSPRTMRIPLLFEPLPQPAAPPARFFARGPGYALAVGPGSLDVLVERRSITVELTGATAQHVRGGELAPSQSHYLTGPDASAWRTGVPNFRSVRVDDAYPGIDLVYYGDTQSALEYDFIVKPGASPEAIALQVRGARARIAANGDLRMEVAGRELRFRRPVIYQERNGVRTEIRGGFRQLGRGRFGFKVESYDRSLPLVIDPILVYSTYFGGPNGTSIWAVAADSSGNAYVGGTTYGGLPLLSQLSSGLGAGFESTPQAFVAKFNAGGTLVYSTYLGSANSGSAVASLAADSSGNLYLAGTANTGFPTTGGVVQATNQGGKDFFVAKLAPAGNSLVYSTFLGGTGTELSGAPGLSHNVAIAVDSSGNAYLAGLSGSNDFPVVNGTGQVSNQGTPGGVVAAKLNPGATALLYSTYVGNTHGPVGGVAVDPSGNLYIVGSIVQTAEFVTTPGAYQPFKMGYDDGFAVKLSPSGSIVYATYLGGSSSSDEAFAVAVDAAGNAYITGLTTSLDFPVKNAYQSQCKGILICIDAFLLRLNAAGSDIDFSTYFGGTGNALNSSAPGGSDIAYSVAIDANGIYVAGETLTPDFPTLNALQSACKRDGAGNCTTDAFLAQFSPTGSLLFSTYLGGTTADRALGVAVDGNGNIFIAGTTDSTNFPRLNAAQNSYPSPGAESSFVTKISTAPAAPGLTPNPTSLTFNGQILNTTSTSQPVTLTSSGNTSVDISSISISGDFLQTNNCPSTLSLGATCTVNVSFRPSATGARGGTVTIASTAGTNTVTLSGTGQTAPDITLSPTSLTFGSVSSGQSSAPQGVTMTNTSGTPLTITSITSANADYLVNTTCGASLGAGANCAINVTFTPVGGGTRPGTITINSNATGSPHIITLTGTGLAPGAAIFPTALDFGTVPVGNASATQQVLVTSNGSQPLTISSVSITGTNAASFARSTNCVTTLANGASCVVDVVFTPTVRGANTATLVFGANAPLSSVALTGSGLGPALAFNPTSLTFPTTTVGNSSAELSSTLTNTGDVPVAIDNISLQFGIDFTKRDNCPPLLNISQSCTVFVKFVPRALGSTAKTNTLIVTSSTPGLPTQQKQLSMSGTATIPAVSVAPASVDFGTRGVGQSASVPLVVVNNSGTTITMGSKTFTGTNAASFSTASDFCNVNLTVNSNNCGVNVVFTASGADGARTASLNLPYTGTTGSPLVVSLTGQVVQTAPLLTFASSSSPNDGTFMFFNLVNLFSTSAAQTLTITNSGNATANISSVQISGQFNYTTTCGATIAAGANCTYTVTFAPVTSLAGTGRIVITSDSPGSPHVITLSASTGNPTPVIDTLNPATVTAGTPSLNLLVNGSRFISGATVRVNGNDRVTNFLSANQLVATVTASDIATAGTLQITVNNPASGGGSSTAVPLVVQPNSPPLGAVETAVNSGNGTATVPQATNLTVTGWAADPEDGSPVAQVQVQMLPPGVTNVSGIYIADTTNHRVRRVDPFGIVTTVAGTGLAGFTGDNGQAISAKIDLSNASAATVAPNGDIYICDMNADRVRKVTASTGVITTIAGGGVATGDGGLATAAALFNPFYATVAPNGDVYFIAQNAVRKVASGTNILTTVAGDPANSTASYSGDGGLATAARLALPSSIAFDSAGNLYIADTGNNRVRKVDKTTNIITTVIGTGANTFNGDGLSGTATNIYGPYGIAFDAQDNLYMASIGQDRIRRWTPGTNLVTTVAGSGSHGFSGDGGAATAAALNFPRGVAVDSVGNIFIGDNLNNRIRRVDKATGVITTVAGTGTAGATGDNGPATSATFSSPAWVTVNGSTDVNGAVFANAVLGGVRSDVAAAQNNGAYLNSGWTSTTNIGIPAVGTYSVRAVATDSKGAMTALGPAKTITVTTGSYALVRTAAATLDAGVAVVGRLAAPKTLTITNDGNSPLNVSSVTSSSGEFVVATNCTGIAAGATCVVQVQMQPAAPGARTATITIISNDPTGQKTFTVNGNGVDITVSLSRPRRTGRNGQPVAAGLGDQEFTATVAAEGLTKVGLACDTGSRDYTCKVTPDSLDLTAANTAKITVSARPRSARLQRSRMPQSLRIIVSSGDVREVFNVNF